MKDSIAVDGQKKKQNMTNAVWITRSLCYCLDCCAFGSVFDFLQIKSVRYCVWEAG